MKMNIGSYDYIRDFIVDHKILPFMIILVIMMIMTMIILVMIMIIY